MNERALMICSVPDKSVAFIAINPASLHHHLPDSLESTTKSTPIIKNTTIVAKKSLITEANEIKIAIELINLGARLQLLETQTSLSRERLLKLYKEIKGSSPPKGMLPFSTDWFLTWQPNIHASLFINIHQYLIDHAGVSGVMALIKAYRLYLEQIQSHPKSCVEPIFSLTRAWTLVRFFDSKLLTTACCVKCGGKFIVHTLDLSDKYVCGLCHLPSRAGKTKKVKENGSISTISDTSKT